jgi:two-component system, sensor histidine kinase PdtaS
MAEIPFFFSKQCRNFHAFLLYLRVKIDPLKTFCMFPDLRTRRVPTAIPIQGFIFFLLFSINFISCSDQTRTATLPLLDSTTDTAAWLRDVRTFSSEANDVNMKLNALNALGNYYSTAAEFDSSLYYYTLSRSEAAEAGLIHEEVVALEKIAGCYLELQQKDSALKSMQTALQISTAANSTEDIAFALQELGIYHVEERDSESALKYFNEEIKYDTLLHDSSSLADCYSNIATVYYQRSDYPRSKRSYRKALEIAERLGNDTDLATYNLNLGIVFREQGSYDTALYHLLKAAPVFEKIRLSKELGSCYNSIGNVYIKTEEPQKAIEYHTRALHLRDSIGNKKGSAGSLTNLAVAYILLEQYDTAISYLERSLMIKYALRDTQLIATSIDLVGEAYYCKKDYVNAEAQYKEALELKAVAGDPKSIAITLNKLALLYHDWGKDMEALNYLREARVQLERIGAKDELMESYKIISDVFVTQGNSDSALHYIDLYVAMKDSVLNEDKQRAVTEMEVKYETETKEQEIALLTERNRAEQATVARQHTFIYSLVVVAALLIVFVFIVVRSRRLALRQSKVIIEQKQTIIDQKQAMMGELHHRIKNNLQVLSSLLELQQSRITDPAMTELMQAIDQRLTAMLLIHQGLYGDDIGSQVNMRNYIDALISNLCQSYGYSANDLAITKDISPIEMDADKALSLGFICNEVISNWFKYALKKKDNAALHIEFTGTRLRFSDNGPGIPREKHTDHNSSFGLRLIKLFSQQLKATLAVESDERGTTITLEIP